MPDIIIDRVTHIEFPDKPSINMSKVSISENSLMLDEVLIDSGLSFGNCNCNKFEVQLYGLPDVANEKIYVYQVVDGTTTVPLFTGYVDSCKQDNLSNYRTLVAYDALNYKGNLNVALWWETFWETRNVATMKDIRHNLLDYMEIEYDATQVLANDDYSLKKPCRATTMSLIDMLGQICEVAGVNANMTRSGGIEFTYFNTDTTKAKNISGKYEGGNSTFEGFTTKKISHLILTNVDDEIIYTAGDTEAQQTNPYTISKNIFFYELTAETGKTVGDAIYEKIKDIAYVPADITMISSDLNIKLGDFIKTDKGYSYVFTNSLSGAYLIEQSLRSKGDEYLNGNRSTYNADIEALRKKTEDEIKLKTSDLVATSYTNTDIITIDNTEKEFFVINFTLNKKTSVMFFATVNMLINGTTYTDSFSITIDGEQHTAYQSRTNNTELDITYRINSTLLEYVPKETYVDGNHNKILYYIFDELQDNKAYDFRGYIKADKGGGSIPRNGVIATVMAVGLVTSDIPWDGKINIIETVNPIEVRSNVIDLTDITETFTNTLYPDNKNTLSTSVGLINVGSNPISISDVEEEITFSVKTVKGIIDATNFQEFTYDISKIHSGTNKFNMRTEYTYLATLGTIDEGKMIELEIPLDEFETINGLEVKYFE